MKKTILVTGGAGFIGSNLCKRLVNEGNKVICLDNLSVGSLKNLTPLKKNKSFNFIKGDVRDKELIDDIIKKVDFVYHLAAVVGVSVVVENPLEDIEVNLIGTKNVTESAFKHGKKKVVFTSSSEVYGKNTDVPLSEEKSQSIFGPTTVSRWAYGLVKALSEHLLISYSEKGLPISIVRYFNSYGPNCLNSKYSNVIPKFISQAIENKNITIYGNGNQTRCFCYVSDSVEGTILAGNDESNGIFNIGNNKETTIKKLAQLIIKFTNSNSKITYIEKEAIFKKKFEDTQRRIPNLNKANKLLNLYPKINLEEGIKKTIKWIRENKNFN